MTAPVRIAPVSVVGHADRTTRWEQLCDFIEALQMQTCTPAEIILVIDRCQPLEMRARRTYTTVHVTANEQEAGVLGACETGLRRARHPIVAFADVATRPCSRWLATLADAYDNANVHATCGSVVAQWEARRPKLIARQLEALFGCSPRWREGRDHRWDHARAVLVNGSVQRDCVIAKGGLATGLAHLAGATRCVPDAVAWRPIPEVATRRHRSRARWVGRGRHVALSRRRSAVYPTTRSTETPAASDASMSTAVHGLRRPAGPLSLLGFLCCLGWLTVGYVTGVRRARHRRDNLEPGHGTPPRLTPSDAHAVGSAHEARDEPAPRRRRAVAIHVALLVTAIAVWVASLRDVDLGDMHVGLITALPLTYWVGAALLMASLAVAVGRPSTPPWLRAMHVVALIAVLHATPAIAYGTLRYAWAWKHVGVVDFMLRHHDATLPVGLRAGQLQAYGGWPGFFGLNTTLVGASGFATALSYASWAPVVFNLLSLGPLLVIFRTFANDRRLVWAAVCIFYLGNWVGQDYFAPQAFGFFLYLTLIALCLRCLPAGKPIWKRRTASAVGEKHSEAGAGAPVLLVASVLVVAIVSSHQLTPLMVIAALGVLWVFGFRRTGLLFVVAIAATAVWTGVFGRDFLVQNADWVFASVGQVWVNSQSVYAAVGSPSSVQSLVVVVDRLLVLAIAILGVVGLRRRRARADGALAVLAVAPFLVLPVSNYGGEAILRIYLFALPFVSFFAAASLFPRSSAGRSRRAPVAIGVVMSFLFAGFVVPYYAKEQSNHFTPQEVAASRWLFTTAPAGSLVTGTSAVLPWAFKRVDRFSYLWLDQQGVSELKRLVAHPGEELVRSMSAGTYTRRYFVWSRSIADDNELRGVLPARTMRRLRNELERSDRFQTVYRNRDATVFELKRPRGDSGGTTATMPARAAGSLPLDSPPHPATRPARSRLVFSDDFRGSQLDATKWRTCYPWAAQSGCTNTANAEEEWYQPSQVHVGDGVLSLNAERRPTAGTDAQGNATTYPYASGLVATTGRFDLTYGYVEFVARTPAGRGLWPALWLIPTSEHSTPEIDVMEAQGSEAGTVHQYFHGAGDEVLAGNRASGLSPGWHRFAVDWEPDSLTWYVDDQAVLTVTSGVPAEPMYLVMNLAVGGWAGPPGPDTPAAASFDIAAVRVWQR